MPLVDMKEDPYEPVGPSGAECCYPYGLQLHLDADDLEKLGLKTPVAGQEYHITAVGQVVGTHLPAGSEDCACDIQITMLELIPEAPHPGEENETAADEMRERVVTKGGVKSVIGG